MSEKKLKPLPLGQQTFKDIIKSDCLYIDKTDEIYNLIQDGTKKYYFLSRPRRFGKSLLVSTLKSIFEGEKELFKNLYIYDKIEWKKYPIIKIDFNNLDMSTSEKLRHHLNIQLEIIAENYNIVFDKADDFKSKFSELITKISKTGKVVILIDEYDKPIIDHIDNLPTAIENRDILKTFYGTLKGMEEHLHFVFITGISKFSKVSIFSELNNINDITMLDKYSKILGIEEKDLFRYFADRITLLAEKLKITEEDLKSIIKKMYNGYSWDGVNSLYNPFSLILLFTNEKIKCYWFETGTPSFIPKLLKKFDLDIKQIENLILEEEYFSSYEIDKINPYAILFQAGYLTVKEIIEYDLEGTRDYVLCFPNKEVKEALFKSLLKNINDEQPPNISVGRMIMYLKNKNLEEFFNMLTTFFDRIPNQIHPEKNSPYRDREFYYHTIFHVIFSLIGLNVQSEISTSKGFIDSVVELEDKIYIFEFKLGKDPQIALEQIENKKYYNSYKSCNKEIILVGVSFDIEFRNIKSWRIYYVRK
ncbi:MAG: AAA family ATPase [Candidatus Sericytochromatia bacterium]